MNTIAPAAPRSIRRPSAPSRANGWSVPLLFGLAAASGVAQTAFLAPGAHHSASALYFIAPAVFVAIALTASRSLPRRYGAGLMGTIGLATVAGVLALFSFGLGFVASGITWAVIPLGVLAFGLTAGVSALVFSRDDVQS